MPIAVPTVSEFNALEARVTALEAGTSPPDPPPIDPGTPSPDGTSATEPGTVLVSAALNSFELCDPATGQNPYAIAINGVRDPVTHDVTQLYAKGGIIYQKAGGPWWYAYNDAAGTWSGASDPTRPDVVPPDPGPGPNPPAVGEFVALYTAGRGSSGTWNFGTGNDDELCDAIEAVEREIGCQVQGYGFFSMYGSMDDWPGNYGWAINCMINSRLGSRLRIPVIGVFPYWSNVAPEYYGWNDDRGLQDAANGRWDTMYRNLAKAVHDNGATEAIWRLGYENNQNFMCSAPGWSQQSETLWAHAFERMSSCIRDESAKVGLNSIICFNPTCGRGGHSLEYMTPSAASFDVYAADLYNGMWPDDMADFDNPQKRREYWATMWLGSDHVIQYAQQMGKPLMLPETGAGNRDDGHGKDNDGDFWAFEASDVCEKARGLGVAYWGPMIWDVPASDIHAHFSNNTQPACQSMIHTHVGDQTLVGDMGSAAVSTTATSSIPIPDWDTITAASKAWIEAHPEFVEAMKKRAQDIVERARANNVGMRA